MHDHAPTSLQPETTKRSEGLFNSEEGKIGMDSVTAPKSVYLDKEFAATGVVFEPVKERKKSFLYGSFQWCEGDDEEVIIMFSTHRVIVKVKRLGHLPEEFSGQKVRRVCVVGRADKMLSDNADVKTAVVTEIKIDRLKDEGPEE
jgi:hypothetical protein